MFEPRNVVTLDGLKTAADIATCVRAQEADAPGFIRRNVWAMTGLTLALTALVIIVVL